MISLPIMDKDQTVVEGCIQLEFKKRNYLSGNPLNGNAEIIRNSQKGVKKLDILSSETLEIFSNQLRVAIEKVKRFTYRRV